METAFYYQVYFRNNPYICIVRVGLYGSDDDEIGSPIAPMERAKAKVIREFKTNDFRIEEASLESILEQFVFIEDIAQLTHL